MTTLRLNRPSSPRPENLDLRAAYRTLFDSDAGRIVLADLSRRFLLHGGANPNPAAHANAYVRAVGGADVVRHIDTMCQPIKEPHHEHD